MCYRCFAPTRYYSRSDAEQLLQLPHGVLGPGDGVADRPGVAEDLVVVAALGGLVAEEVDGRVLDAARPLGLVLQVLQAVRLVPAVGEDVEGDLAADGEAVLSGPPGGVRLVRCFHADRRDVTHQLYIYIEGEAGRGKRKG